MRRLTIEKWKPEGAEPQGIDYKNLGYYYDTKLNICVFVRKIQYDLEVGQVYEFTYEDDDDCDSYDYLILKKDGDVYYMVEYYEKIYDNHTESLLGDVWVKCDVKEELGIDLEEWKKFVPEQRYTLLPDMREKVKEYISELDDEINKCTLWVKENMSGDACKVSEMEGRIKTLTEVKNDLESRLSELL